MRFKDFEFRKTNSSGDKYELVKWRDGCECCCVVGWIQYDPKEPGWTFDGCGLRYQQCYEEGLNDFVLKYVDLLDLQKKYHKKDVDEFYEHY